MKRFKMIEEAASVNDKVFEIHFGGFWAPEVQCQDYGAKDSDSAKLNSANQRRASHCELLSFATVETRTRQGEVMIGSIMLRCSSLTKYHGH